MLFPCAKSAISLSSSDSHVYSCSLCRVYCGNHWHRGQGQDYGLLLCNPVFPSTFFLSCCTWRPVTGLDATGLAFWAVSFIIMRFRHGFQILCRRLLRCSQTVLCWLHVFTLVLVLFHLCIAKGHNCVDFFTTMPAEVTWNYYVSERFNDFIVLIFVG